MSICYVPCHAKCYMSMFKLSCKMSDLKDPHLPKKTNNHLLQFGLLWWYLLGHSRGTPLSVRALKSGGRKLCRRCFSNPKSDRVGIVPSETNSNLSQIEPFFHATCGNLTLFPQFSVFIYVFSCVNWKHHWGCILTSIPPAWWSVSLSFTRGERFPRWHFDALTGHNCDDKT